MKEVIVFGGSGFLGSYVADELTRRGFDVVIADLHESKYIQGKQKFKKVYNVKPPSSRSDSSEKFVVALGFRG